MSGKRLNTEAITSELAGSAFFPIKPVNNRQTDVPSEPPTAAAHVAPTDLKPNVAAAKPVPKSVIKPQGAARPYVGYSQLTVAPCLVNGFTPRVGRRW